MKKMKTLLVYYSRTRATKKIADKLADKLKADKEEIIDKKNRKGIIGYLIAAKDATLKKLTKIKELNKNPKNYGLLIIGTPIWACSSTPAVRTFLTKIRNYNKKIAFFCTMGGSGAENAFKQMKAFLPNSKLIATLSLTSFEIRLGKYNGKIEAFINKIKND